MTDLNTQCNRGASRAGSTQAKREELTPEQFEHEKEKRDRIYDHEHAHDNDDYIQETD
jgi:hypothetical protein